MTKERLELLADLVIADIAKRNQIEEPLDEICTLAGCETPIPLFTKKKAIWDCEISLNPETLYNRWDFAKVSIPIHVFMKFMDGKIETVSGVEYSLEGFSRGYDAELAKEDQIERAAHHNYLTK